MEQWNDLHLIHILLALRLQTRRRSHHGKTLTLDYLQVIWPLMGIREGKNLRYHSIVHLHRSYPFLSFMVPILRFGWISAWIISRLSIFLSVCGLLLPHYIWRTMRQSGCRCKKLNLAWVIRLCLLMKYKRNLGLMITDMQ